MMSKDKNFVRGHNRRIKLDEGLIKNLYIKEKLSANEISLRLNCGVTK